MREREKSHNTTKQSMIALLVFFDRCWYRPRSKSLASRISKKKKNKPIKSLYCYEETIVILSSTCFWNKPFFHSTNWKKRLTKAIYTTIRIEWRSHSENNNTKTIAFIAYRAMWRERKKSYPCVQFVLTLAFFHLLQIRFVLFFILPVRFAHYVGIHMEIVPHYISTAVFSVPFMNYIHTRWKSKSITTDDKLFLNYSNDNLVCICFIIQL